MHECLFKICRFFRKYPDFWELFHTFGKDFGQPPGESDPERYRGSKALRQHGATVLKMLDSFVKNFKPGKEMQEQAKYVASKHFHLRGHGVSGSSFLVFLHPFIIDN